MLSNSPVVLREMMAAPNLIWGPGVYDCVSAHIAQQVGFPILYMTGAGTAASRIGQPDLGLTTSTEMVDNARNIQAVIDVPLIADADTGFGGVINVIRTVHQYEQAGVAGIHIEDQTFPKRCGHLQGKTVVERSEFIRRIRAAAHERWNSAFVIIARTDARQPLGFDEARARIEEAFAAGADIGFLEAPQSLDEIERIVQFAPGPMLLNMATNGQTPTLTVDEIQQLGFKFAVWPAAAMIPAARAIWHTLRTLKEKGTDHDVYTESPREFFEWVGLSEVMATDARYKA